MTTVSIVTPWLAHPELRAEYDRATAGAEVIIVDTSDMRPFSFAAACNLGIARATGDIIVCLNNDIQAVPGWLDAVRRDVKPGALYGVSTDIRVVDGYTIMYLEGWCIAALVQTWRDLGGWDAETFQRPYWEDVDLSWRATQQQIRLVRRPWMVTHLGNRTSATTPGAYDASAANGRAFARKVRAARMVAA